MSSEVIPDLVEFFGLQERGVVFRLFEVVGKPEAAVKLALADGLKAYL